jgi:riboflavin kinase / FMN adenylyltransferase
MLIIHGSRTADRPVAVTIGNFDGVHRGHQAMVARTISAARERGLRSCVLTFEPHPREFFAPDAAPTRLTTMREKLELLDSLGVECTYIARFNHRFAGLPAEAFVQDVLVRTLLARWVLVGEDFRFGARRAGDVRLLRSLAPSVNMEVEVIETVTEGGVRVSSSAVRSALAQGQLSRAELLLGRRYSISGRVVRGDGLGRALGFPTANIQLKHNHPPLLGIYAVRVHGVGPNARDGVASLGFRPTVSTADRAVLEAFVFDFEGDLYGRHLRIEFITKIRDEEKYADLDALRAAIAADCAAARDHLRRLAADAGARPPDV